MPANESLVGRGLGGLKEGLASGAGVGALTGLTELATGASKTKAILESIKWTVFARAGVASFAIIVPAVYSLIFGIRKAVTESGILQAALERLGQTKVLTNQFDGFLGNIELAKKRVAELYAFVASSKFNLNEAAGASKALTIKTNGAEGGIGTLQSLGKIATATGSDLQELALAYGNFSDQARKGEDISGTVEQLKEMGVFSESTANQLIGLQRAGATGANLMGAFRDNIAAVAAASGTAEPTLEGLQDKVEKLKQSAAAGFGKSWMAQQQKDLENQVKLWTALNSVSEKFGSILQTISQPAVNLKNLLYSFTGTDFFKGALATLTSMIVALPLAAAGWAILKRSMSGEGFAPLLSTLKNTVKMIVAPASTVRGLARGVTEKGMEMAARGAGVEGAKGLLTRAGAEGLGAGGKGLEVLAKGITASGSALLRLLAVAGEAAPVVIAVTAAAYVGVKAWDAWRDSVARAKSAADAVKEAMGISGATRQEIASLKTLDDKTRLLTQARQELNAALEAQATVRGDSGSTESQEAAAAALVTERRRALREIEAVNESNLGMTAKEFNYRIRQLGIEREIADLQFDASLNRAGAAEKVNLLMQRQVELAKTIAGYEKSRGIQPEVEKIDRSLEGKRGERLREYKGFSDEAESLRERAAFLEGKPANRRLLSERRELEANRGRQAQLQERMKTLAHDTPEEQALKARRAALLTSPQASEADFLMQKATEARGKGPEGERRAQELEIEAGRLRVRSEAEARKELAERAVQAQFAEEERVKEKRDYDTTRAVRAKQDEASSAAANGNFALASAATKAAQDLQDRNDDANRLQELMIKAGNNGIEQENARAKVVQEAKDRERSRQVAISNRLTQSGRTLEERQLALGVRGIGPSALTGTAAQGKLLGMQDVDEFRKNFGDLTEGLGALTEDQTRVFAERARKMTEAGILEGAPAPGFGQVADSLTKIGLGGGLFAGATGDPQLAAQKRIGDLQVEANKILESIRDKKIGVK